MDHESLLLVAQNLINLWKFRSQAGQLWCYILVTLEVEWLLSKLMSTIYHHGDNIRFPGQANTVTPIVPLVPTNPYAHALDPAVVLHSSGVAGFQTNIHKRLAFITMETAFQET